MGAMKRLLGIASLVILFGCISAGEERTTQERPTLYVSMVQLLADREEYADYPVAVTGYLSRDGGNLFLSAEHAQMVDLVAGFPVSIAYRDVDISEHGIARTGCEDQFVRVYGEFEKSGIEFMIVSINKITRFDASAGLQFEDKSPTGRPVVCWRN